MLEIALIVVPPLVIGYVLIRAALRLIGKAIGLLIPRSAPAPAQPFADGEIVIAVRRLR